MKREAFVNSIIGRVGKTAYWYGTYIAQVGTESLLTAKAKQYPSVYTPEYIEKCRKWLGWVVCDCVGLIKGTIWQADYGGKYQAASDLSANGMYQACTEQGPIATLPEVPGVLVWKQGHIGVYIGGGYAVESRSVEWGVVKTLVKDRGWTNWGKCHLVDYTVIPEIDWEAEAKRLATENAYLKARLSEETARYDALSAKVKAWQEATENLMQT